MSEKKVSASSRNLKLLQEYNKEANRITQESIETALLLLMEEKNFASISITEITSRAGVSRTAYYRNYSSKEDVLRNLFNRVEDSIMEKIREFLIHDTFNAYLELFQAFSQEAQSLRVIHKAGLSWDYLMEMNRRFTADLPEGNDAQCYQKYFWMGALCNVVFMWIDKGMKQTPEEMAEICKTFPSS